MPLLQVGWGRFFFFFGLTVVRQYRSGSSRLCFAPSTASSNASVDHSSGKYSGTPGLVQIDPNLDGRYDGLASFNQASSIPVIYDGSNCAVSDVEGLTGFEPLAINAQDPLATSAQGSLAIDVYGYLTADAGSLLTTDEVSNINVHSNGLQGPTSEYGWNFTESQLIANVGIAAAVPGVPVLTNAQELPNTNDHVNDAGIGNSLQNMELYQPSFITSSQSTHDVVMPSISYNIPVAAPPITNLNPVPTETSTTALGTKHICRYCATSFGRSSDLKRHALKHQSGPRPFSCPSDGCPYKGAKGFTRKDKMRDHVKNMHAEINPGAL